MTRIASRLGVTPSAISEQVARLRRMKLVTLDKRGLRLTPHGHAVAEDAVRRPATYPHGNPIPGTGAAIASDLRPPCLGRRRSSLGPRLTDNLRVRPSAGGKLRRAGPPKRAPAPKTA